MSALEKRIVSALASETGSAELAALLTEAEAAITSAEETAEVERERAFDPALSPDPAKARKAMEDNAFAASRLRTLMPRLQRAREGVLGAEYLRAWRAEYETVEIKRDALAAELREVYPPAVEKLADLFSRLKAFDLELSQLHSRRPAGVIEHLICPELVARDMKSFGGGKPPLATNLQLPSWENSAMKWPLPVVPLGVLLAQSMSFAHPGADWALDRDARAADRRAEDERVAAYYEEHERKREKEA